METKTNYMSKCKECGTLLIKKRKTKLYCNHSCRGNYNKSFKRLKKKKVLILNLIEKVSQIDPNEELKQLYNAIYQR